MHRTAPDDGILAGDELRLLRESHRLTAADVAREARVTRQRVSQVEGMPSPSRRSVELYVAAVRRASQARILARARELVGAK